MLINFVALIVGMVLLIKGADYLIKGAVALSKRLGVSELFIGLTVVAFGTSAPELAVSIQAALKGSGIAIGNVVGSNIANIALILGTVSIIKPLKISSSTFRYEIPFLILTSLAAGMLLLDGGSFLSRFDGIVLLCFFIIFLDYLCSMAKKDRKVLLDMERTEEIEQQSKIGSYLSLSILATVGGLISIIYGGKLVIDNAVLIAKAAGVSETLIGVTIVALGTSLPELVAGITATLKKKADIAVGNVIGSNVFNILLILGISACLNPIKADRNLTQDNIFMIGTATILPILAGRKKTLRRLGGIILLLLYFTYIYLGILAG
ncbi:MAG TPA: calcium/sodium antiporter [Thermotogaceae bacterium]|nr:calcium/sodium antiporter [Thermotogaceae bacterium]